MFRALRHRNFRLFWFGQMVSLIGTWMQSLALGWLVWRLTHSPLWLGVAGAMPFMPSLFLSSFGGVLVDRYDKRRVLIITQSGMAFLSAVLGILTVSGIIQLYQIIILAILVGLMMAMDTPARLAFIREMVGKDDLDNAIALNSTVFNSARIVGPPIAGFLVPLVGEGGCFLINALTFSGVIVSLLSMRGLEQIRIINPDPFLRQLAQAFSFMRRHDVIRPLMIALAFYGVFGFTMVVLMPIFADRVLNVGVRGLGALMGAMGIGALSSSLMVATFSRDSRRGRMVLGGAIGVALGFLGFSLSRSFLLSLALLALAGFAMFLMLNSLIILIQKQTPHELLGRVMGLYTTGFIGLVPIGNILAGVVASAIGAPATMLIGSTVCLGVAIFVLGRSRSVLAL